MDNPLGRILKTAWNFSVLRCRVPEDLAEVTSVNPEEVDPHSVGVDPAGVESI
jgi:hypothetical protein